MFLAGSLLLYGGGIMLGLTLAEKVEWWVLWTKWRLWLSVSSSS